MRLGYTAIALVITLTGAPSVTRAETSSETPHSATLTQSMVAGIISAIQTELRDGYVFPEKGAAASAVFQQSLTDSKYANVADPVEFARQVTDQLRATTDDGHMRLIFGSSFSNQPPSKIQEGAGFEVKRLDGGIGLIRLERFVPPDVFKPAADKAMREVSDSNALVIDMQSNGGGHPASVAYLVSYFLETEKPVHINGLIWRNRGTNTFRTEEFWSSSTPFRYDKPVNVLVGPKTYSAGEEFAYDLQALKRAKVVGAKTRGGANPGGLVEIDSDFFVVVPTGRAENPITRTNWEGVGIRPDIQATPEVAEAVAVALAKG